MNVEVVRQVPVILLPYIDPWLIQEPSLLDLEIVANMQAQMDESTAHLLRHEYVYAFVIRDSPWRAQLHLFSLGGPRTVQSFKAITQYALTLYHRLEGRFQNRKIAALAKRCGWHHEATYKNSFRLKDGGFIDEYGVAICRE